jgi:broad-specificity NMP kinase
MVIEFCGLPGAGKSTIARALLKHGLVRVRIRNKGELLWYNLVYLCMYPLAFFKMLFRIIKTSCTHGRFYRLFMNVFLDTNARIAKAKWGSVPMIVDQGHLQALLSLSYHELSSDEVGAFLTHLPKPDKVFVFEAPALIRSAHLKERGYEPREEETNTEEWLKHLEGNMKTIAEYALQKKAYPVQVVSTDRPLETIVEEIRATV